MIVTDTVEDNKLPDIQVNQESQGGARLPAPYYRPDESSRLERARRWMRVARGEDFTETER